jgi:transposase
MVTLGSDSHKRTHTFVAVDETGKQLDYQTLPATTAGHLEALRWASQWTERRWALENCRHLSRRLESDLLRAGEGVVLVQARLMAAVRATGRQLGKSDPIDALAVARAALREPNLPMARLEGKSREVKLLLDHREDLVAERTRICCRLHWNLHEIEPELVLSDSALIRWCVMDRVEKVVLEHSGLLAEIALEQLESIRRLTSRIKAIGLQLRGLMRELTPTLIQLQGCAELSAAKLFAESADIRRFQTRAAFALNNGTAPIPVWSGNSVRHRLNRGGNRQLNAAIYRIAIIQARDEGLGRTYMAKRLALGNTRREALRSLKRRISDEVFRRLWQDLPLALREPAYAAA